MYALLKATLYIRLLIFHSFMKKCSLRQIFTYAAFLKTLKRKVHMRSLFSTSNRMLNTSMWKSIAEHVYMGEC